MFVDAPKTSEALQCEATPDSPVQSKQLEVMSSLADEAENSADAPADASAETTVEEATQPPSTELSDGESGGAAAEEWATIGLQALGYSSFSDATGVKIEEAMTLVGAAVAVAHGMPEDLSAVVSEPQTTKTLMKSFVTYQVFTKPLGHVVRRRYSDFQWLREALQKRYVGMLIPPLPPRGADSMSTAAGSSTKEDSQFVQRRMRTLSKFLNDVVSNSYLRGDEAVKAFVSIQVDKDFEKAKVECMEATSVGWSAWRIYKKSNAAPEDMDRVVRALRQQLDMIERYYNKALAVSKQFAFKAGDYARDIAVLKEAFAEVLAQESNLTDETKTECVNPSGKEMVSTMNGLKSAIEAWCGTASQRPPVYENVVRPTLEFLLYQAAAFREVLNFRDLAKQDHAAAVKVLEGHQKNKDSGKTETSSLFGKKKDIDACISEAEDIVNIKKAHLDDVDSALNWCEIIRFNEMRHFQFRSMVSMMMSAERSFSGGIMEMWTSAMTCHGYEMENSIAEVQTLIPDFAKTDNPFEDKVANNDNCGDMGAV